MTSLEQFIGTQKESALPAQDALRLFDAISKASLEIAATLSTPNLKGLSGVQGERNVHGEAQQKLDVFSHEVFIKHCQNTGIIAGMASEESSDLVHFENSKGDYLLCIDPLDGSSNVDVNVSVGSIFSIYRRPPSSKGGVQKQDFLQKGRDQVLAGYAMYGAATMLVITLGNGVFGFTLSPKDETFFLSHPSIKFPRNGKIFSISEGYYHQFPEYIKAYIAHCKNIEKRLHTARYVGSLVADFHRNLLKGGVYAYPENHSSPKGKLRLVYECNAIAMLTEQAGGLATDGNKRILDITPEDLHQTIAFASGPADMMAEMQRLYDKHGR